MQNLGADLKHLCQEKGLSQSALAMKVGVSASHLNQIINGRARPSSDLIRRILDVLRSERAGSRWLSRPRPG